MPKHKNKRHRKKRLRTQPDVWGKKSIFCYRLDAELTLHVKCQEVRDITRGSWLSGKDQCGHAWQRGHSAGWPDHLKPTTETVWPPQSWGNLPPTDASFNKRRRRKIKLWNLLFAFKSCSGDARTTLGLYCRLLYLAEWVSRIFLYGIQDQLNWSWTERRVGVRFGYRRSNSLLCFWIKWLN